jgi:hypothetical protein
MKKKLLKIISSKEFLIFFISLIIITSSIQLRYGDPMMSRIMTVRSIVEHRTLDINTVPDYFSIDKICRDSECYSTKPPLLTIIGAGFYFIYYNLLNLKFYSLTYYLLTFSTIGIFFSLILFFFYRTMGWFKIDTAKKLLFTLSLGFGTLLFTYSVNFSNHILSALLTFLSFITILKIELGETSKKYIALVGFLTSLIFINEVLQGLIISITFFIYLLLKDSTRKYFYLYILASLPAIIFYIFYNLQITGNVFPAYLNEKLYHYPGGYWMNPNGIDALSHSKPVYFFNLIFGTHGILVYSPILFFGAWGLIKTIKDKRSVLRNPAILVATTCLLILITLTFLTNNYGGSSYGFRWFILCYPMLFFFVIALSGKLTHKLFARTYITVLLFSIFFAYIGFIIIFPWYDFTFLGHLIYFPLLDQLGGFLYYILTFIHNFILA